MCFFAKLMAHGISSDLESKAQRAQIFRIQPPLAGLGFGGFKLGVCSWRPLSGRAQGRS